MLVSTKSEQIMAQKKSPDYLILRDEKFATIRGKPTIRQLPSMGVEILCLAAYCAVSHVKRDGDDHFLFSLANATGKRETIDAFRYRDAFLAVETPAEAFELLSRGGRFRETRNDPNAIESVLAWTEFRLWQEVVRIVLTQNFLHLGDFESPDAWPFVWGDGKDGVPITPLSGEIKQLVRNVSETTFKWLQGLTDSWQVIAEPDPEDSQRRFKMHTEVSAATILEAMLAGIYVDTLSGVQYELCALPGCNRVYEVQSKHERAYCSQACAHKASVRRRRAQAKVEQEKKIAKNTAGQKKGKR